MHFEDKEVGASLVFVDCYGYGGREVEGTDTEPYVHMGVRQGVVRVGVVVSPGRAREIAAEIIKAADFAERCDE